MLSLLKIGSGDGWDASALVEARVGVGACALLAVGVCALGRVGACSACSSLVVEAGASSCGALDGRIGVLVRLVCLACAMGALGAGVLIGCGVGAIGLLASTSALPCSSVLLL